MDESGIDAVATTLGEELISRILENNSVEIISGLLDSGSPVWYQNEIEGISPLHAAAFVQDAELVKLLIEKGAVWNAGWLSSPLACCTNSNEQYRNSWPPEKYSWRYRSVLQQRRYLYVDPRCRHPFRCIPDLKCIWTSIVCWDIAELLLGLLGTRTLTDSSTLLLHATDATASGSSDAFLKSKVRYKVEYSQSICVLDVDGEEIGVMMGWEEDIMRETVQKLCLDHPKASGLKVLNIGFGLGIVSSFFKHKNSCWR